MRLTKKEKELLGRQYAERIFRGNPGSPADLPALAQRRDWQEAPEWERRDIIAELAALARAELLKAGHNRETVDKYVGTYLRHW